MQTIVDYIKSKAVADTSMAIAVKMLNENIGAQEACILALFQAMYETNKKLADEVLRLRGKSVKILAP
jgi:hypothetical protein